MKVSARNNLVGIVSNIQAGAINAEVTIQPKSRSHLGRFAHNSLRY